MLDVSWTDVECPMYLWIEYLWRDRLGRLSIQVLQEFYVTVTQKLDPKLPKETARQDVRDLLSWRPIVSDAKLIADAWSAQDRHKTSWWDSLIIAASQSAGCRYLLSEDLQDGQVFDNIEVVNPSCTALHQFFISQEQRIFDALLRSLDVRLTPSFARCYVPEVRFLAKVAELADALDLGSSGISHGGSSPPFRIARERVIPVKMCSYEE